MKRFVKLFILLPLLAFAQNSDQQDLPGKESIPADNRTDLRGCVLAFDGNKINFEECWMLPSSAGMTITGTDGEELAFSSLRAPFYAEIDINSAGRQTYVTRLRVLKQFEYGTDGVIIGIYNEADTK